MTKSFVPRSQFFIIVLTSLATTDFMVEADEAYITSLDATNPITLKRAKEIELSKLSAQSDYILNNVNGCTQVTVAQAAGRVSIHSVPVAGALTSTTNGLPTGVGIKETIRLGIGTATAGLTQKVLIELVHYAPESLIGA